MIIARGPNSVKLLLTDAMLFHLTGEMCGNDDSIGISVQVLYFFFNKHQVHNIRTAFS